MAPGGPQRSCGAGPVPDQVPHRPLRRELLRAGRGLVRRPGPPRPGSRQAHHQPVPTSVADPALDPDPELKFRIRIQQKVKEHINKSVNSGLFVLLDSSIE